MRVLGLDIATVTGWAQIEGEVVEAGTYRPDRVGDAELAAKFRSWLHDFLSSREPIDLVAIEAPFSSMFRPVVDDSADLFRATPGIRYVTNPKTDLKLNWLNVIAQMTCHERGIPFVLVPVLTHRKAFLGAGRVPKGEGKKLAIAQCRRLGIAVKSADAADAVSIAFWGCGHLRHGRLRPEDLFA